MKDCSLRPWVAAAAAAAVDLDELKGLRGLHVFSQQVSRRALKGILGGSAHQGSSDPWRHSASFKGVLAFSCKLRGSGFLKTTLLHLLAS